MITSLELGITDGVSVSLVLINVWRLAGDTLNITCNFLYCNHQVHRDILIALCSFNETEVYSLVKSTTHVRNLVKNPNLNNVKGS
jgi:hypothetical protein